MSAGITASIIVCVFNGERHVRRCLESLVTQDLPGVEIIVVDDGSSDATPQIAAEFEPRIRLLTHARNRGLSAARNTGLAAATGDIICFTDIDCVARPEWARSVVETFASNPDVHGIGGRVEAATPRTLTEIWYAYSPATAGSHRVADAGRPSIIARLLRIAGLRRARLPRDGEDLKVILGANSSFRRRTALRLSGWHPAIRFGGDDVDFSERLQAAGLRQIYADSAIVEHHHRDSLIAFARHAFSYGRGGGRLRLLKGRGMVAGVLSLPIRLSPFIASAVWLGSPVWLATLPAYVVAISLPATLPRAFSHRRPDLVVGLPLADLIWRFAHYFGYLAALGERLAPRRSTFWTTVREASEKPGTQVSDDAPIRTDA